LKDDRLTIGGQAVIEGVMMRSPDLVVTSVRRPGGEIVHRAEPYVSVTKRNSILAIPVIRGAISLFETLYIGIKSLSYSAEIASEEAEGENSRGLENGAGTGENAGRAEAAGRARADAAEGARRAEGAGAEATVRPEGAGAGAAGGAEAGGAEAAGRRGAAAARGSGRKPGPGGWKSSLSMGGTIVLALAIGLLLFFWLPLVVAEHVGVKGSVLFNVVDGLVRLAIFFLYLALISLWRDMRRVFEYHGAEHKCITTYEDGEDLTLENARRHTTSHRRCGTSFLLIVMVIAIIVFIFMGRPDSITDRLRRFALVPLIAGISYELTRLAGRKSAGALFRVITAPGLLLQRFTAREPSDDQIEVALDALRRALHLEGVEQDVGSAQESS
jgi:uncharacterized protein YqhQ